MRLTSASLWNSRLAEPTSHRAIVAGGGETGPPPKSGPSRRLVHLVIDATLAALTQKTPERTDALKSASLDALTDHRIWLATRKPIVTEYSSFWRSGPGSGQP